MLTLPLIHLQRRNSDKLYFFFLDGAQNGAWTDYYGKMATKPPHLLVTTFTLVLGSMCEWTTFVALRILYTVHYQHQQGNFGPLSLK